MLGSMVIGSVGYNPNVYPIYKEVISRLLTIDPNFLGHPSGVISKLVTKASKFVYTKRSWELSQTYPLPTNGTFENNDVPNSPGRIYSLEGRQYFCHTGLPLTTLLYQETPPKAKCSWLLQPLPLWNITMRRVLNLHLHLLRNKK